MLPALRRLHLQDDDLVEDPMIPGLGRLLAVLAHHNQHNIADIAPPRCAAVTRARRRAPLGPTAA